MTRSSFETSRLLSKEVQIIRFNTSILPLVFGIDFRISIGF